MPLFIIERNFAEQIEIDPTNEVILKANEEIGVKWLYSLSLHWIRKRPIACTKPPMRKRCMRQRAR